MKDLERSLMTVAKALAVEEQSLRVSIDEIAPFPTLDVLVAATRHYGVDPHWLVTGVYDPATHASAAAAEDECRPDSVRRLIAHLTVDRLDWPLSRGMRPGGSELTN